MPKNEFSMTLSEYRTQEGLTNELEYEERLEELVTDSICPALCIEGCEVEPDGHCEHGCPSLLLAAELI